jgi:hypothetical protein
MPPFNDDEEAPPPPMHPHPDDARRSNMNGANGDEAGVDDSDPDDEQSVEIPRTTVVDRMKEEEDQKESTSRTPMYVGIVVVLLVIIAVVLGAGFGTGAFQGKSKDSSSSEVAPPAPSNPPAPSTPPITPPTPTTAPAPVAPLSREQAFTEYLSNVSVNGAESFQDPESGEARAMQWLVNEDPLQLDPLQPDDKEQINQRYALATFYYASDTTADQTNWLNEDECTWFGVSCEAQRRRRLDDAPAADAAVASFKAVLSLDWTSNSYDGTLPADVTLLSMLTSLKLADNDMTGQIPDGIWSMTKLVELSLYDNKLSGQIASSIGDMVGLSKFSFSRVYDFYWALDPIL